VTCAIDGDCLSDVLLWEWIGPYSPLLRPGLKYTKWTSIFQNSPSTPLVRRCAVSSTFFLFPPPQTHILWWAGDPFLSNPQRRLDASFPFVPFDSLLSECSLPDSRWQECDYTFFSPSDFCDVTLRIAFYANHRLRPLGLLTLT